MLMAKIVAQAFEMLWMDMHGPAQIIKELQAKNRASVSWTLQTSRPTAHSSLSSSSSLSTSASASCSVIGMQDREWKYCRTGRGSDACGRDKPAMVQASWAAKELQHGACSRTSFHSFHQNVKSQVTVLRITPDVEACCCPAW